MKAPADLRTEEGILAFRDQLVRDFSKIEQDRPVMQHAILIVPADPASGTRLPTPGVFALFQAGEWDEKTFKDQVRVAAARFGALGVFGVCRKPKDGVMLLTLDHVTLGERTWEYSADSGEHSGLTQLCEQRDIPEGLWSKRLLPSRYMN